MSHRMERDSMGEIKVASDRYWGAQTQRALERFPGGDRIPQPLIRAYAIVKQAAARVNARHGDVPKDIARAISAAAQEIIDGKLDDEFPLSVWQSGSGTQTNMNLNEVIANRASEILGGKRGAERRVHPNDHVNRSQSTNDTFPAATHVAVAMEATRATHPQLSELITTLERLAKQYDDVIKTGRTHLMDATPVTLGQVMGGWAAQLSDARDAIERALEPVFELALGGTAVGTGINAHPKYAARVAHEVAELTGLPFVSAPNKFAVMGAHDALVGFSGATRQLAAALFKIANDVRWLASGPRCGIGEIRIPANEPGSSIMPGKVNPSQCEALTMVCCHVFGLDSAVAMAGTQGNFELNVYKPLIAFNVLTSLRLLAEAMESFHHRCVAGIEPNRERIAELLDRSLMLVTALAPHIGYDRAAKIALSAHERGITLRDAALDDGVSGEDFDRYVDPSKMVGPHRD